MDINFCYIPGISRENTLYFSSLQEQHSYFTSLQATKVITNTFYPPYYRNAIKVDTADIDLSSNYNYMFFEYNDKYYYYFISNVSYLSEDVLTISVEMDTIQTYFFDITLHSAIIRRKFIDRYSSIGDINRNYIRENVSINLKELHSRKEYKSSTDFALSNTSDDPIKGYYILIFSSYPKPDTKNPVTYKSAVTINGKTVGSPYLYGIIPDYKFNESYQIIVNGTSGTAIFTDKFNPSQALAYWSSYSQLYKCVYVPLNIFSSYMSINESVLIINSGLINSIIASDEKSLFITSSELDKAFPAAMLSENFLRDTYQFGFYHNQEKAKPFDKFQVPALLDENYINILFGDNRANSTFPLHLLGRDFLYLDYRYDFDGNCYFNVFPYIDEYAKYNTISIANPSDVSVVTDAYRNYLSYNKYAFAGAIASTAIGIGASVLTANPLPAIGSVASSMNVASGAVTASDSLTAHFPTRLPKASTHYTLYNRSNGPRTYTVGHTMLSSLSAGDEAPMSFNASSMNPGSSGYDIPGSAFGSLAHLVGASTAAANAYAAPDIPKGYGSAIQDVCSYASQLKFEVSYVHDLDVCAQYYHRYGYLVNEYIDSTNTIFRDVNNRYYFNYLELSECDVELSCLQFDSCINDIAIRFQSGIRLWNPTITTTSSGTSITFSIGDYRYDNVERSALNG